MAARLSYALSRGTAVAEVAWLYPQWDAENFANFVVEPGAFESETSKALRRAGFSYDRISRSALASSTSEAGMLQVGQGTYEALLVEGRLAAAPEMLSGIERAAAAGVPVIWIGELPERADGLLDAQARDAAVATLVERLRLLVTVVPSVEDIPGAIASAGVTPSLGPVDSAGLQLSVARRQVSDGDIYFLFNESYEERTEQLRIEDAFTDAVLFDPETGQAIATERNGDTATVTLAGARGALLWVARAK